MQDFETESVSTVQDAEASAREKARLQLTNDLNQLLRRLKSYETEGAWIAAVSEGASRFASESGLFTISAESLRLRAQNGLHLPVDFSMPISAGAAFGAAMESRDPVVALRSASEVGEKLSSVNRADRAHLFPISNGDRVVAVIFAVGNDLDPGGMELWGSVASLAVQRPANLGLHTQITLASVTSAKAPERRLPVWAHLPPDEQYKHMRARRFARVKVAEMEISRPEACRAGRKEGDFYLFLKREIDAARDSYRKQFMTNPQMTDYLHLELVKIAGEGDEQKLGADYPGQLD